MDESKGIVTVVARIEGRGTSKTVSAPTTRVGSKRTKVAGRVSAARKRDATVRFQSGLGGGISNMPIALADSSPLAAIQYTLTRYERLQLYRYYAKTDPYVGRALEIHTALPLSRMQLVLPNSKDEEKNKQSLREAERMVKRLQWYRKLRQIVRMNFRDGDVYLWFEWSEQRKEWDRVFILPPEFCHTRLKPFTNEELVIYMRPLFDTKLLTRLQESDLYTGIDLGDISAELEEDIPDELKKAAHGKPIVLNTDPYKGSCVFHLARNRTDIDEYGESMIDRILESLLGLENLKNAQLQISSRNMSPKHLIFAEGVSEPELDALRDQVDLSLIEPDFPIVTNYPVTWNVIGVNERLLDLGLEYEQRLMSIAVGLGLTREFLTGEGLYSGQRINLQVLNTEYLELRETLAFITEEFLLKPVAWAKGHVEETIEENWIVLDPGKEISEDAKINITENGDVLVKSNTIHKEPIVPSLRFNRLSIRDDIEVFDILFQLYLKGSLDVSYLLDLFNIDEEENAKRLIQSVGTVNDSQFNNLLMNSYSMASQALLESTDFMDRIIQGLNLKMKTNPIIPQQPAGDPMGGAPAGIPPAYGATTPEMQIDQMQGPANEAEKPRPGQDPEASPEDRAAPEKQVIEPATGESWHKGKLLKNSSGQYVKYESLSPEEQIKYQTWHLTGKKP